MSAPLTDRLEQLAATLDYPPTPDLVPTTVARLPARDTPPHRRRARSARRGLAIALAVLLILGGAAFAIAPSRHAILDVLGLRGVRIERVPHIPSGLPPRGSGLGQSIPVSGARHAAAFRALLPPVIAAAYLDRGVPGGRITLVTGTGRLFVTELRAHAFPVIYKLIASGTRRRTLHLGHGPAVYVYGAPSELLVLERSGGTLTLNRHRTGDVLVWQRGPLTILIEGSRSLSEALTTARSLH